MAEQVPAIRDTELPPVRQPGREPSFGGIDTVFDRMVRGILGPTLTARPWPGGYVPAVEMHCGSYFGNIFPRAANGVIDSKTMPQRQTVHPVDGYRLSSLRLDRRTWHQAFKAPDDRLRQIAVELLSKLRYADAVIS